MAPMASAPPPPRASAEARGIRFWVLAVSLSASLPMMALLVGVTLWLQHDQNRHREASIQRMALRAAEAVDSLLAAEVARLTTLAAGVAAREQRFDVLHQVLQSVARTDERIGSLSFIDTRGRRVLDSRFPLDSVLPPSGSPELDQLILRGGMTEWSPLVKGAVSGRHVVGLGVPVRDAEGRTVGGMRLVLRPEPMDQLLLRLAAPPGWVMAVVDQNAVIVARNQAPEQYRGQRATDTLIAQLKRPPGEVHAGVARDGRAVLAVVQPIGSTGWHVAVGAPEAEVERAARETLAWVVLAGLCVAAASLAASLWTGRHIAQQVRRTAAGTTSGSGIRELQTLGRRMEVAESALTDARRDSLTGLLGRAHFLEEAQRLLSGCVPGERFGVLYLDLDGFKALNDAQGHDAGDLALAHVGEVLRSVLRPADLAARFGGDEFVVLLSGGGDAHIEWYHRVAERVRDGVNRFGEGLGCSIGVATALGGEPIAEALTAADQALLAAKRAGKGRIVLA